MVFLGTPEVAATVLQRLVQASRLPDSCFEVMAVVSQPGKPKGRGNRGVATPSPAAAAAAQLGLDEHQILCPASAKDPAFLEQLRALQPDLCITAAYGNMLPTAFLSIPRLGTLNIHPSLLPLYRGAAPVQRALQDGVLESGVSVAYTVLKCDAGPVLQQSKVVVDPNIQAPELLSQLFALGAEALLERLPDVWAGRGAELAVPQDEARVVHAAKLCKEDSVLDLANSDAQTLHNRVRAFAGWPGTSAAFSVVDEVTGASETMDIKILETRIADDSHSPGAPSPSTATPSTPSDCSGGPQGGSKASSTASSASIAPSAHTAATATAGTAAAAAPQFAPGTVSWAGDAMVLPCGGGGTLLVLRVQPPTKKAMAARDFRNGLRGKRLTFAGLASS